MEPDQEYRSVIKDWQKNDIHSGRLKAFPTEETLGEEFQVDLLGWDGTAKNLMV